MFTATKFPRFRSGDRLFSIFVTDLLFILCSLSSIAPSSLKNFSYKGHFVRDWSVLMKSPELFCLARLNNDDETNFVSEKFSIRLRSRITLG